MNLGQGIWGLAPTSTLKRVWQWVVLMVGLFLFAVSIVLQVKSDLGLGPWDIFHVGISRVTGVSLGLVSIGVGLLVMVIAYLIARVIPGPATVANMVMIGVFIDLVYPVIPVMTQFPFKLLLFIFGMILMGLATAVYIGAGLGAGPRDSLMLGIHRATGRSVRTARTIIEATVFVAGLALGGKFGLGTVLFVAGIGPVVQAFLSLLRVNALEP